MAGATASAGLRGPATALAIALAAPAMLGGCGGGGGGGVRTTPDPIATPAPTPTPTSSTPPPIVTPAPSPTPSPTPTSSPLVPDTPEYRASKGPVSMNALAAYQRGATGAGVTIAVIDSGIDLESTEFSGRIAAASGDVAATRSVDDEEGHGTAVAFTAAGRRNGAGTHGVAFEATVLAIRTDTPGSCGAGPMDEQECSFRDSDIARGIDLAVANGARVVNLSLGGNTPSNNVVQALGRATAAGVLLVVSAGNDGEDNPDGFAQVANNPAARGLVIVAGSIGTDDVISSFSNRAGNTASHYLTAVGERINAPGPDNRLLVWSGTSFAAPQIAGAVALLAQAFPNLTGTQLAELILSTARDLGTAGTDTIYGRGAVDLTRAFQPQGTMSVAGTTAAVADQVNASLSAPMGDAGQGTLGMVVLDGYDRAYALDLARSIRRHAPDRRTLTSALGGRTRQLSAGAGDTALALTLVPQGTATTLDRLLLRGAEAEQARALAGVVTRRLGRRASFAIATGEGADSLAGRLAGAAEPAFLVARDPVRSTGFDSAAAAAAAVRRQIGGWGLTAAAESGTVHADRDDPAGLLTPERGGYARFALALDRQLGALTLSAAASRMAESGTLLGASFSDALGRVEGRSTFLDLGLRIEPGDGWRLWGRYRLGWTGARMGGGIEGGGLLATRAFALDLGKQEVLAPGDSAGLRLTAPLRVLAGGLDYRLPDQWDYATGSVSGWRDGRLNLTPTGRALDAEMRYAVPMGEGWLAGNLFWRRDPGNIAALDDELGAALRFSLGF